MTRKFLLQCGIFSSLLYIAMNIFIPLQFEGYNSASQTVSELSAIDTPTRTTWVIFGSLYTLLCIAFSIGVLQTANQNKFLRITGFLLLSYGIVSLFWPFAPMHQREALAIGAKNLSDNMHITLAFITVILMILAMGFGAVAIGKWFRTYTLLSIIILLFFGILTSLDAPRLEANLPTPLAGVWERINIGIFLLWMVVLALVLLRRVKSEPN